MRCDIVSIFPDYLSPLSLALTGKAIEDGLLEVYVHDLRRWAHDVHKSVDDSPYGGGPGMVMKPLVVGAALADIADCSGEAANTPAMESSMPHRGGVRHDEKQGTEFTGYSTHPDIDPSRGETDEDYTKPLLIVPSPAGVPFTQHMAEQWSDEPHLVFLPGRYEGIDQRVIDKAADTYRVREVSIGDYVLIGGEVAVLTMLEAITRLIPGVLGNASSHLEDSFTTGLLEGPCYTKPAEWEGIAVPPVLLSGNHKMIDRWRRDQSLHRTYTRRPDLLEIQRQAGNLDKHDEAFLATLQQDDQQAK